MLDVAAIRASMPAVTERAYLNTGTFGPWPDAVREAIEEHVRLVHGHGRIGEEAYAWELQLEADARAGLARMVGADADRLALAHCTSDGLNLVVGGIDWEAGDEVVIGDAEHPGLLVPLDYASRRRGVEVRVAAITDAIEAALTPRTAAFAFSVNVENQRDLLLVVEICRPRGIPVIVDAAAQLPPKANLRRFLELGADLVAFSGGKAIGGPQASGILAGRKDLVGAALVQQIDMDVSPATWSPPDLIDRAAMKGVPHHGLGRGFKAGKEEIVGLLAALERFVGADDEAANAQLETRLAAIARALDGLAGVTPRLVPARVTGRVPVLELAIDPEGAGTDAVALGAKLQQGDPPVHLSERYLTRGVLTVDPQALQAEDDAALAGAVRRALG